MNFEKGKQLPTILQDTPDRKEIERLIIKNLQNIDEKFSEITSIFVMNGYYLRYQFEKKCMKQQGMTHLKTI